MHCRYNLPGPGWLLALVLLGAGCSTSVPTYPLSGQVVYRDGEPVRQARVELEIASNDANGPGNYSAILDDQGRFQLKARAAEYKAIVVPNVEQKGTVQGSDIPPHISRKYMSYLDSDLRVRVTPDAAKNEVKLVVDRP